MRKLAKYHEIPFNHKLADRASDMRKGYNLAETLLWEKLRNGEFLDLDFDRQKIIGQYIADFYCAEKNVVIEIDGGSHDNKQEYDEIRDAFMKGLNITVIRIPDIDVKTDIRGVMIYLRKHSAFK